MVNEIIIRLRNQIKSLCRFSYSNCVEWSWTHLENYFVWYIPNNINIRNSQKRIIQDSRQTKLLRAEEIESNNNNSQFHAITIKSIKHFLVCYLSPSSKVQWTNGNRKKNYYWPYQDERNSIAIVRNVGYIFIAFLIH